MTITKLFPYETMDLNTGEIEIVYAKSPLGALETAYLVFAGRTLPVDYVERLAVGGVSIAYGDVAVLRNPVGGTYRPR